MCTLLTTSWLIRIIILVVILFVGWIWFATSYEISKGVLKIRCGPFKSYIPIKEIKSIKQTQGLLASAALSRDRLEVKYGFSVMILISPKDRYKFVELLEKENENIKIIM